MSTACAVCSAYAAPCILYRYLCYRERTRPQFLRRTLSFRSHVATSLPRKRLGKKNLECIVAMLSEKQASKNDPFLSLVVSNLSSSAGALGLMNYYIELKVTGRQANACFPIKLGSHLVIPGETIRDLSMGGLLNVLFRISIQSDESRSKFSGTEWIEICPSRPMQFQPGFYCLKVKEHERLWQARTAQTVSCSIDWIPSDPKSSGLHATTEPTNVVVKTDMEQARQHCTFTNVASSACESCGVPKPPASGFATSNNDEQSRKRKCTGPNDAVKIKPGTMYRFWWRKHSWITAPDVQNRCPWCFLDCSNTEGLTQHLTASHSRFHFDIEMVGKVFVINVICNDHGGSPSVSNEEESFFYYSREDVKFDWTRFMNSVKRRKISAAQTVTSDRVYHRSLSQDFRGELDGDSDHESCSPEGVNWILRQSGSLLDDFVDVNEAEKQVFKLWNSHILNLNIISDGRIPEACFSFARKNATRLRSLRNNFALHLSNLHDFGLVSGSEVRSILNVLNI